MTVTNQPYVYCWTQKSTGMLYVGIRYSKTCHPQESTNVYIATHKIVREGVRQNPEDWSKQIVATGTKEDVIKLERSILRNLRGDPKCFNKNMKEHNPNFHGKSGSTKSYWSILSTEERSIRNLRGASKVDHSAKNVKRAQTMRLNGTFDQMRENISKSRSKEERSEAAKRGHLTRNSNRKHNDT